MVASLIGIVTLKQDTLPFLRAMVVVGLYFVIWINDLAWERAWNALVLAEDLLDYVV